MGKGNILIVDDDPDTCQSLDTLFRKQEYSTTVVYSGEKALNNISLNEPELVVLDIMMPGMDGWETCRRMKTMTDVPILFLSARTDVDSVAQGFRVGGDDFVCKPFQIKDLITRAENLLQKQTAVPLESSSTEAHKASCELHLIPDQGQRRFYFLCKRLLDILFAGIALVVLSPLILLVALLVKFESPGPIIFKQERIHPIRHGGSQGGPSGIKTFTFFKFRTMYESCNSNPHRDYLQTFILKDKKEKAENHCDDSHIRKIADDPRVTHLGRFLRKSSLDEFPQLWNVIKGDMTLVGPRPELPYAIEFYEPWHRKRLEATPGITGLWQVTSRSIADFDEMVRMDAWYIEHQSLWLDLLILIKTPFAVLSTRGAV